MPPRNVRPLCFWSSVCTPLFEWAHGRSELLLPNNIHAPRNAARSVSLKITPATDAGIPFKRIRDPIEFPAFAEHQDL
jgi:hypothetical protein